MTIVLIKCSLASDSRFQKQGPIATLFVSESTLSTSRIMGPDGRWKSLRVGSRARQCLGAGLPACRLSVDEDDDLVKLPALPAMAASLQVQPAPEPVHEDSESADEAAAFPLSAESLLIAERASGAEWTVAADNAQTPRKGLAKTLSHISEGDEACSTHGSPQRQGSGMSGGAGGPPAARRPPGLATNNAVPWRPSPSKVPALPRKSSRA